MKTLVPFESRRQAGGALMLTMIMTGVALAVLAGAMTWSANTTRHTHRSIQYARSVAAAEGATEKVVSKMSRDFLSGGNQLVGDSLGNYRQIVPTGTDSTFWNQWQFSDARGYANQTSVTLGYANKYTLLDSAYAGLRGFVTMYRVVSQAKDTAASQNVAAGVQQEVQLARIPIFQFAMYSSANMEISCGQPLTINGRVHSNRILYVEPDSVLTFQSDVTAVQDIIFGRDPLDNTRGTPKGGAVYVYPDKKNPHVPAMTLPIGTTNTPEAIREIIQPPPVGESATSPLGRLRYYNQADLVITVANTGVTATSGSFNNFLTVIPTNQINAFVVLTNSFRDAREEKTVRPIDLNIGALKAWGETNSNLRPALGSNVLASVYVWDRRTLAGTNLGAVRVVNGQNLPLRGLTVATARPLYVFGHFNETNSAHLATTNTSQTRPASLVADAITLLSVNWKDANSTTKVDSGSRDAKPTTVNAALLTGVVETTSGKYSGGMENFPRFLETWGSANVLTYNGSMVKMFPSLYATNAWGKSDVYAPPKRDWAYDINFDDAAKLPPLTPSLVKVLRGQWATVVATGPSAKAGTP